MTDKLSLYSALDALAARIPEVECQRKCQESCGPILCSALEWQRIREAGPVPTPEGINCPMLVNGACSVYSVRPLICRIWAAVKSMRCPHGCKPKRWLSDKEAHAILDEAVRLSSGEIAGPADWIIGELRKHRT